MRLREDQRRLPPSSDDRFAVQITPPTPFHLRVARRAGDAAGLSARRLSDRHHGATRDLTVRRSIGAKGGQIAPTRRKGGRAAVLCGVLPAKDDRLKVLSSIHSKILTNLAEASRRGDRHRVPRGGKVSLTRTLISTSAPLCRRRGAGALKILAPARPGQVRLDAERMKTFDGDVTLQISPVLGLNLPEMVIIPKGQTGVDITLKVDADRTPGRHSINLSATAAVNGLEEEQRGSFIVEIEKKAVPKK